MLIGAKWRDVERHILQMTSPAVFERPDDLPIAAFDELYWDGTEFERAAGVLRAMLSLTAGRLRAFHNLALAS